MIGTLRATCVFVLVAMVAATSDWMKDPCASNPCAETEKCITKGLLHRQYKCKARRSCKKVTCKAGHECVVIKKPVSSTKELSDSKKKHKKFKKRAVCKVEGETLLDEWTAPAEDNTTEKNLNRREKKRAKKDAADKAVKKEEHHEDAEMRFDELSKKDGKPKHKDGSDKKKSKKDKEHKEDKEDKKDKKEKKGKKDKKAKHDQEHRRRRLSS